MTYLFVVFILINGVWVQGDDIEGWGSMPYESLEACLEAISRAEKIQKDLLVLVYLSIDSLGVCVCLFVCLFVCLQLLVPQLLAFL